MIALLDESIEGGAFSLARFGEHGLGACNPLLAFQLMNNFTMCHGAILEGVGGPNGALFSRGAGTTAALIQAVHAIRQEDCDHAVAGGADSATHPVTRAELARITAEVLIIGVPGDLLFPYPLQYELYRELQAAGASAQLWKLDSEFGHDAFLADQERLAGLIRDAGFLAEVRAAVDVFEPQAEAVMRVTAGIKAALDPAGVLNPGRMYAGV